MRPPHSDALRTELQQLPMFRGAAPDALTRLALIAVECRFAPGEVLFRAGDQPRGWYVVLDGRVRVVRGGSGRQHVVHTERAGGTLGEVALLAGTPHPATGIAAEPTRCVLFQRADLERVMAACPPVATILLARLANRVTVLVNRLDERSARSVQSRLAEFLLGRHAAAGKDLISLGMTQQILAEELGTVREVVSRELRALARTGFIASRGGGRWIVIDAEGLRRLR